MADTGHRSQIAGADEDGLRFRYDQTVRFQLDVSPFCGGWCSMGDVVGGVPTYMLQDSVGASGEPAVTPVTGTADTRMYFALNNIVRENITDAPGVIASLKNATVRHRLVAGSTAYFLINSAPKAGGGGVATTIIAWDHTAEFTVDGAWHSYTAPVEFVGLNLDVEANVYWLEIRLRNNATQSDANFGVILLDFTKTAVE